MAKSKKKFLLTSLALAVPLVVTITSACSEIGLTSPTTKTDKKKQDAQKETETPETQPGTETSPKTPETQPGPRIKSRDFLEWFAKTPETRPGTETK